MSGARLAWTVDDAATRRALDHMLRSLEDPAPVNRALADGQKGRVEERFKDQAGPGGAPWAELADSTLKKRRRMRLEPITILRARGDLVGSLNTTADAVGFVLGTGTEVEHYAAIHQFGGATGRNRATVIPARPYLGFDDEDLDVMQEELLDWLAEGDVA